MPLSPALYVCSCTWAMVCTCPTGFGSQFIHWSARLMVSGSPLFAGCCRSVMLTTASCTAASGGGPASGPISHSSASWVSGSPLFAVIFNR